jgi:HEAT repeat protein
MDFSQESVNSGPGEMPSPIAAAPRPSADYGTLGPGSDVACGSSPKFEGSHFGSWAAVAIGVLVAVLASSLGKAHAAWSRMAGIFHPQAVTTSHPPSTRELDDMNAQKQAEALLELAVAQSDGAVDQISSRVDQWHGKLNWDSQIATLTTAALNSRDMRVRESGIAVELAAYGLRPNSASFQYVLKTVDSANHAQKIWGLWALGLMGNRGVETDRARQTLTAHLKDPDEDSRRWAVEGLSLLGEDEVIPTLLTAMHDDASPLVREEAACGIAQSGMFTREQRLSAVPQLLNYTQDPALDAQTHGWAFQALTDITGQHLPNDGAAWRHWYESRN